MNGFKLIILAVLILLFLTVTLFAADIHEAALKGNLAKVKELLKNQPGDLNAKTEAGFTPLHQAVQGGHQDVVKFLVAQGADINSQDSQGAIPLIYALASRNVKMAEYLLAHGADVTIKTKEGVNAAAYVVFMGITELIDPVLDLGLNVNEKYPLDITLLHGAAVMDHAEIVAALLKRGAEVDVLSENDETPLYFAAARGFAGPMRHLLAHGAKTHFKIKKSGWTALHAAALNGYSEIVAQLLSHGADIEATDTKKRTPLFYAAKYGHKKTAELLKKKGAKPKKLEENYGRSPLLQKKLKSKEAVVWYLGGSGWAVKTKDRLLVFDYAAGGKAPDEPFLTNGHINPQEIKGQKVFVFTTHGHGDHFSPEIFTWEKSLKNITYIMGFKPPKTPETTPEFIQMNPRETKVIDGMEITTITSTDEGVGFLVELDDLTVFHAGDHANKQKDLKGPYAVEIDYLAGKKLDLDIAFLPISGCGFSDPESVKKGAIYAVNKLKPKAVFPMHADDGGYLYQEFAQEAAAKNCPVKISCAENGGDHFIYSNGKIK